MGARDAGRFGARDLRDVRETSVGARARGFLSGVESARRAARHSRRPICADLRRLRFLPGADGVAG